MEPHFMFNNWCWIPIVFCLLCFFGFGRRRFFGPWGMQSWRGEESRERNSDESALDVLNKRYARGEISKEDYLEMKKNIVN